MIVTSVVVMVYAFDQTESAIDIITVEMDLMKLTAVSTYIITYSKYIHIQLHPYCLIEIPIIHS